MSLRELQIAAHPEFPWLRAGDVEQMEGLLRGLNWLRADERVLACETAGEGNMNLTLRVRTDQRSMILKQARPWVEKYDDIPAPWDRNLFEQRFYQRVSRIPEVAERMPRVIAADEDARVLMIEDLGEAGDFTDLYTGTAITETETRSLAAYLRALHDGTRGPVDPDLANREMRALNHQHIIVIPLQEDNGVDLEVHELWLEGAAGALKRDMAFCMAAAAVGERYLSDGPCLVHGDFFPGSWFRTADGVRVIDPEFCFFGDAEFDIGVCLAHLRMARQDFDAAKLFLSAYVAGDRDASFDLEWIARFAAVEIMRRIIGVAQLPIPPSEGFRARLLNNARAAMMNLSVEDLWV